MIYKDKNTRLQTSKHEESRRYFYYARRYNERNDRRKIIDIFLTLELLFL
jgi:hypothetical protein